MSAFGMSEVGGGLSQVELRVVSLKPTPTLFNFSRLAFWKSVILDFLKIFLLKKVLKTIALFVYPRSIVVL